MEKLILLLDGIICDLCFSGLADADNDFVAQLERAAAFCRELDMKLGEALCLRLANEISSKSNDNAAKTLCRLSCYAQCLSGASAQI